MNNVAVQGASVANNGGIVSGGAFVITSPPSLKTKAGGLGVFRGTLAFTFSGGSVAGGVPGSAVGAGSINPGSLKTKADGQSVVLENDTGTMNGTYMVGSTPTPFTNAPVKISSAGQTKVKGS